MPELHKDGATWHIHGLLHGISLSLLQQFKTGDKMGTSLAKKVQQGDVVYNWPEYQKRFGFCDLEPVKNHEAVSKYMTKYITKSLSSSVKELNAHLYYHSRGLKTAEVIKKGSMFADIEPSYRNEYCSMTWLPFSEELLQKLCNSFSFDWESPEYFTSEFEMWQGEIENDGAAGVRGLSCGAADQRQFPKTLIYYQSGMNRFRGFLNQNPELSELTLSLLRKYALYLQSENLSTVTRQSYVRALRAFLTWCYSEDLLLVNLSEKFRLPKAKRKVIDILTDEEARRLMSSFNLRYSLQLRN